MQNFLLEAADSQIDVGVNASEDSHSQVIILAHKELFIGCC